MSALETGTGTGFLPALASVSILVSPVSKLFTAASCGIVIPGVCAVVHLTELMRRREVNMVSYARLVIDDQDVERVSHARAGIEPVEVTFLLLRILKGNTSGINW